MSWRAGRRLEGCVQNIHSIDGWPGSTIVRAVDDKFADFGASGRVSAVAQKNLLCEGWQHLLGGREEKLGTQGGSNLTF